MERLKDGVRPGLGDSVIRLGPKAQRGQDTIGSYNIDYSMMDLILKSIIRIHYYVG